VLQEDQISAADTSFYKDFFQTFAAYCLFSGEGGGLPCCKTMLPKKEESPKCLFQK
jgi:hypothetical protein